MVDDSENIEAGGYQQVTILISRQTERSCINCPSVGGTSKQLLHTLRRTDVMAA